LKIEEKIAASNAELLFEVCKIRVRSYAELPFDVLRNHCSKSRGITVRGGAEYAGVGRAIDNVYIERFWRSVKYELIHLNVSQRMTELRLKLEKYIYFYNQRRPHQALRYATPEEAYSELTETRRGVRSPIWAFTPKDRNCEFDKVSASDIAREYSNIWTEGNVLKSLS